MGIVTVREVLRLFPNATTRRYRKNQIICYNGDKPQHVYFISKGHIRYYDIDGEGNEKILHINGPQNIFPMLYAFGVSEEIVGFYSSIDEVELVCVPLKDFHKVISQNIDFSNALVKWFLAEISQLVFRLNSLEKTEAKAKIMYALKSLAINYGKPNATWQKIDFPVTHQFIADYTGLARETVSIAMQDLEKSKAIKRGKLRSLEVSRNALDKLA